MTLTPTSEKRIEKTVIVYCHNITFWHRSHDAIDATYVNCTGYDFGGRPPRLVQWRRRRSWCTGQGARPLFCESVTASAVHCYVCCYCSCLRSSDYRSGRRRSNCRARPIVGDRKDLAVSVSSTTATNGCRTTRSSKTITRNRQLLQHPSNPYSTMQLPCTVESFLYYIL